MLSDDEVSRVTGVVHFKLPRIYAITDTRLSGMSHAEQVDQLALGGIELIQLREKHSSPREFYESAKAAVEMAKSHDVKIVINDRVDIALALRVDGVHLGQDDLPPEHARKILGDDAIIGFSTHSLDQAMAAIKLPVDYIAFGPIFPTKTKENPDAVTGLPLLRQVRDSVGNFPLVAIGGIDSGNIDDVFAARADSAALIGALVSDGESISERTRRLISIGSRIH